MVYFPKTGLDLAKVLGPRRIRELRILIQINCIIGKQTALHVVVSPLYPTFYTIPP